MNITEFLEARIDEDESRAGSGWSRLGDTRWETDNYGRNFLTPAAVLAECKAKRSIIQYVIAARADRTRDAEADAVYRSAWWTATRLASVYADHPDYQQDWAL